MKKLVTLLLAAGLVFSAANSASAVEVKTSGTMNFAFDWVGNIDNPFMDYDDAVHNYGRRSNEKQFGAIQRLRLNLEFVMSENLSATYQAQVGTFTWGGPTTPGTARLGGNNTEVTGGALGTRAGNIVTRFAYLDWMIPDTSVKVRMGQQPVALPSFTFGSPVLDSTGTGIVVAAPINDNVGVTGMWVRGNSDFRRGNSVTAEHIDDNLDIFGLIGDFKYDGFRVQPWAAVGLVGKNSALYGNGYDNATAWMVGVSGELSMFDPFLFTADFYYGALDTGNLRVPGSNISYKGAETDGWYAALGAEYKTAYGIPALKGWYASGDGKPGARYFDANGDYITEKAGGQAFAFWGKGGFNATSTYFDGAFAGMGRHNGNSEPIGSWGISAQWNDISFVENLSHALSVTYVQGTNNKQNYLNPGVGYLTTKDSLVEIDFNTTYNIYQNLATVLEIGYIIEDFDGKNLARNLGEDNFKYEYSNAWRASLNFQYKF